MIISAIDVYAGTENIGISPSLSSTSPSCLGRIFPQCDKDGPQRLQNFSSKLQKEMSSTFPIILQKKKKKKKNQEKDPFGGMTILESL